jgi:hypothetical protein
MQLRLQHSRVQRGCGCCCTSWAHHACGCTSCMLCLTSGHILHIHLQVRTLVSFRSDSVAFPQLHLDCSYYVCLLCCWALSIALQVWPQPRRHVCVTAAGCGAEHTAGKAAAWSGGPTHACWQCPGMLCSVNACIVCCFFVGISYCATTLVSYPLPSSRAYPGSSTCLRS